MDSKTWKRLNTFDAIMERLHHKWGKRFKEIEAEADAFLVKLNNI